MTYDDIVHGIDNILTSNMARSHRYAAGEGMMVIDPTSVPSAPIT